jgi:hypothetical protein
MNPSLPVWGSRAPVIACEASEACLGEMRLMAVRTSMSDTTPRRGTARKSVDLHRRPVAANEFEGGT